jgi:hypothetical protein
VPVFEPGLVDVPFTKRELEPEPDDPDPDPDPDPGPDPSPDPEEVIPEPGLLQ